MLKLHQSRAYSRADQATHPATGLLLSAYTLSEQSDKLDFNLRMRPTPWSQPSSPLAPLVDVSFLSTCSIFLRVSPTTSALDTITEANIQEALDRLGNDRTVLVIAHRLGTIKNADNIIVLKDGMVTEEGTHEQLLAKGGQYADMWNMQLNSTKSSSASLAGFDIE